MTATKMMMTATNSMTRPPITPKATAKMVGRVTEVGAMKVGVRIEEKVGGTTVVEPSVVELSVVVGVESVDPAGAR